MAESLAEGIAQFAGSGFVAPGGAEPDRSGNAGEGQRMDAWPAAALDLLERAEERARQGDWQGYGLALDELRALLRRLGGGAD
jgi:hypothetical protein